MQPVRGYLSVSTLWLVRRPEPAPVPRFAVRCPLQPVHSLTLNCDACGARHDSCACCRTCAVRPDSHRGILALISLLAPFVRRRVASWHFDQHLCCRSFCRASHSTGLIFAKSACQQNACRHSCDGIAGRHGGGCQICCATSSGPNFSSFECLLTSCRRN